MVGITDSELGEICNCRKCISFLKQIITEPRPITHMEAVSIALVWKVRKSLFHCNGLQQQRSYFALIFPFRSLLLSLLLHFGSLPAVVRPPVWKLSFHLPPWAPSRPENSMTLHRHDTTPVRRGLLNLQNMSAGARQLLWSAANLSCLPPLWSCLNKNESGWSWRHKEL